MKIFNFLTVLCWMAMLAGISGCNKDKVPPPSYQDAIWLYQPITLAFGTIDSGGIRAALRTDHSFYFSGASVMDTIWLPEARAMGVPSGKARAINLAVLPSSTAIEGTHFKLINGGMPADSLKTRLGVVLLRTPDMQGGFFSIDLQLLPNQDFPATIANDTLSPDRTFLLATKYTIGVTDQLVKPPFWEDYSIYLGNFSKTKYYFIVATLGIYPGVRPISPQDASDVFSQYLRLKSALDVYNKEHPGAPLTDENGYTIYF